MMNDVAEGKTNFKKSRTLVQETELDFPGFENSQEEHYENKDVSFIEYGDKFSFNNEDNVNSHIVLHKKRRSNSNTMTPEESRELYKKKLYTSIVSIGRFVSPESAPKLSQMNKLFRTIYEGGNQKNNKIWPIILTRVINRNNENPQLFEPEFNKLAIHLRNLNLLNKNNIHITESLYYSNKLFFLLSNSSLIDSKSQGLKNVYNVNKDKTWLKDGISNLSVIMHDSLFRKAWDFAVIILLIISIFLVPLIQLRSEEEWIQTMFHIIDSASDCIFFLDIALNFRTAFVNEKNEAVTDLIEIRNTYLKTNFVFDMISTFPLEIFFFGQAFYMLIVCKVNRVFRLSRIFNFVNHTSKVVWARLTTIIFIFIAFSHWIGLIAYMALNSADVFKYTLIDEKHECVTLNSIGPKSFTFACQYNYAIFYGLSIGLNEDIEYYNFGFNLLLLVLITFVKLVITIIYNLISSYFFSLSDQADSRFKTRILIENLLEKFPEKDTKQEVLLFYNYLFRKEHLRKNKENLSSFLQPTLYEKLIANEISKVVKELDFLCSPLVDDKILGMFITKLKSQVYLFGDYVYTSGEISKGLYVFNSGRLTFFNEDYKDVKYQIPQEDNDEDWLNLSGDQIRGVFISSETKENGLLPKEVF